MEQSAYLMESLAGVICLALGVRLYWCSQRSVRFSDRLMAIALLIWGAGYAAYDIPYAFVDGNERISPVFSYGSTLLFNLGNVALAWFVKEVFRRRENWAGWAVVATAIVSLLPCMREATVSPLFGDAGFAVKAAVPRDQLARVIPAVKAAGGTDLVVTAINQIVP